MTLVDGRRGFVRFLKAHAFFLLDKRKAKCENAKIAKATAYQISHFISLFHFLLFAFRFSLSAFRFSLSNDKYIFFDATTLLNARRALHNLCC